MTAALLVLGLALSAQATVFFEESFSNDYADRWTISKAKDDLGKWELSAGKFYNDKEADQGLKTTQDAHFYAISAKFDKFSNEGKDLVIQFRVKHEQNIDCGGGYVKVFPSALESEKMDGESPYNIMFGPDICGPGTRKVHVIFNYKGENHLIKKNIPCKFDEASHLYTLIVKPDQTYEVRIDGDKVESGSLLDDFDFLPPKEIEDESITKPEDWVDEEMMADPEDTKPDGWDDIPEFIADPEAEQPEDWDEEMDGEYEAPQIPNPEYKGEWKPKQIKNPDYKGPWVQPMKANPEYEVDNSIYAFEDFGAIGLDLWQVKSGTIFDDILITDDVAEAEKAAEGFKALVEGEKKMKDAADEEARKAAEEAAAAAADDEEEEDDDEDDEDDEAPAKDEL
jgi:calreticulin